MKKYFLLFFLIGTISVSAQKERSAKMGQTTLEELKMSVYEKDSTAAALVLYEEGNYYRDGNNKYKFATDHYKRIKIFDKDRAEDKVTISIITYKEMSVKDIKAITYTLEDGKKKQVVLTEDAIFSVQETEEFKRTTFTLPNITSGCVVEYSYKLLSPYLSIRDWYFQSDIPKLKSAFKTAILGNYDYNVKLQGFYTLDKNEGVVKRDCLEMPNGGIAACGASTYEIDNITAFESEDYMLGEKNYLSRISFNLKSITTLTQTGAGYGKSVNKDVKNFTKTWKDTDRTLRLDFLNNQGAKKSFFKRQLPEGILKKTDVLEKAKSIYSFIQDRYTWNKLNWISSNIKVKKSFDERTGSVDEINLSLYNSLRAANIESYITLVSTRGNGMPTKLFPVLNDFNYLIVKIVIDNTEYFLDATNKQRPFGEIPFKCLNGDARVFDFKKGSYWQNINIAKGAGERIDTEISLNEEGNILADISITSNGYNATKIRDKFSEIGEDQYIVQIESNAQGSEVEEYQIENIKELEKPIKETYQLISDDDFSNSKTIRIQPVIRGRTTNNPFKLKERLFPVDFGYKRTIIQRINVTIPEGYKVTKLPSDTGIKLPNKGGSYIYKVQNIDGFVKIYIRYQIFKKVFTSEEYFYLKEFFNKIIQSEAGFIEIEKI